MILINVSTFPLRVHVLALARQPKINDSSISPRYRNTRRRSINSNMLHSNSKQLAVSCLCVGATNAGKTLLLRKLERHTNIDDTTSSVPTVGTIIYKIKLSNNRIVTIRELGGSVAPLWSHYYHDISKILFVVDASNLCQISASGVLLYGILSEPSLHRAEVGAFFPSSRSFELN